MKIKWVNFGVQNPRKYNIAYFCYINPRKIFSRKNSFQSKSFNLSLAFNLSLVFEVGILLF